ncbi:BKACE family enzyme [Natronorubrum daqingense]|uniref:3-keto-5-aminohexanoate cleavage enzyme n=1 Tax=Natronorubrum daqingense TaxID=588898 RepID=A0A1N7EU33_9EURY|nr:3-keto-5-aminohexanoate cleavage protein [Natronorubrum daqingense]APX97713.1 3-keto-5-aminohexanoate cleavage protein [Natronorubrum daqingense]SIR91638.1 3-keto-5-aminohexanoate cleavage enzyme [Natronorubrum daqingense]
MSYQDYLAGEPLILTVPTTGGVQGKEANPNLPESPEEIANAARECEKLGASIVHLHGRDEHGERDASRLQEINELVRERCEDIIVQNTTGGTGLPLEERVKGIRTDPLPEMASLDMGPMNRYQHITAENTRHMIDTLAAEMQEKGIKPEMEVFNNGHLNEVYRLIEKGLLEEPYYINIIFGPGTLTPPTPENMVNMINNLPENSIFNVLAIGRHQLPLTTMGIVMGGHIRVGMEDNLYYRKGEPVESNAQLVERAVRIADELERELATPTDAREMLGL